MIRPRMGIYILIALFAACGSVDDADQAESGDIVSAEDLDAFPMREGDCFNDSSDLTQARSVKTGRGGLAEGIAAIPCSESHDNELYAVFDLSDRLPYLALERFPGEEGIVSFSRDGSSNFDFITDNHTISFHSKKRAHSHQSDYHI